jgi:hypothetical protein
MEGPRIATAINVNMVPRLVAHIYYYQFTACETGQQRGENCEEKSWLLDTYGDGCWSWRWRWSWESNGSEATFSERAAGSRQLYLPLLFHTSSLAVATCAELKIGSNIDVIGRDFFEPVHFKNGSVTGARWIPAHTNSADTGDGVRPYMV